MTDLGRLFSMLFLLAVLLCPAGEMRKEYTQPVFFSMIFPQLIPEWMLDKRDQEGVAL